MKQWLKTNFLSADNAINESSTISKKEFYIEMSMVGMALALFGILLHALGS